ncbi:MAG: hypothetical protein E6R03_10560 [Hyphomicrobiaceae bacterium]|nr:MAG: hypothetical protein E6R03_10560 [Hyphomicrobiaceae bacterium]
MEQSFIDNSDEQILKEVETRLQRANKDRDHHKKRLDDYYRLAMPWRHLSGQEYSESNIDEIFDNTAVDSTVDFASEMRATFTPENFEWMEAVPASTLGPVEAEEVKPQAREYNGSIFYEIRRSNFQAESLECYQDLSHGTMALMIVDRDPSRPIHCEAIPANEIRIARGINKEVDLRAIDSLIYADQVISLFPKAQENQTLIDELKNNPSSEIKITQAVWRDYSDLGNEKWKYVAYYGKYILDKDVYVGAGSCPFIVARWMTDSSTSWGIGPGYLQLPNIKTANLLKELILKNADYAVDPATAYDDDGIMNLEQGLAPGVHIPRAPGSKIDILESRSQFDVGYFQQNELRDEIKRGYYQDQPFQKGKTPPTAEQWLDEAARAARRMGAPAGRLVTEWQIPIYKRFAYLLGKRGILPKVELGGKIVTLQPSSPLIRKQKIDEALNIQRYIGVLASVVGIEMANMIVNKPEAAHQLKELMNVPDGVILKKEEIKQLVAQTMASNMAETAQNVMG